MHNKKIKIGPLLLKNPIILAPMVDVTDSAYRQLCISQGCSLVFTQMLYTSQIINENPKTKELMSFSKSERPIGIQITGSSLEEFKACLPYLKPYDVIDLNCGCPSLKITGNQAGSYLLNNPDKIVKIIKLLKTAFPEKTITAKIRLGFKKNNVMKIAKAIEKAGADAITIHPRLATQGSSVPADHKWTKALVTALKIPVIANGDIFSGKDALSILQQTGCSAVMIARGAIGDPTLFSRINHYLKTNSEPKRNQKKNIKLFLEYLKISKKYKISDLARVKYIGVQFIKDFKDSAKCRAEFSKLKSMKEIELYIKELIKSL
ncbi:tRNA dihydrouridine synthase DusB [Candidatus Pacearchaeota archaeon]|nr:tRNA dihydrouridine synthase DusB [Candidatus Pacearchaeota archaeon]|tara:strand:+ start:3907 stop:4866 length:960 start_codon:yes stop_codon:yes gene_type:complete